MTSKFYSFHSLSIANDPTSYKRNHAVLDVCDLARSREISHEKQYHKLNERISFFMPTGILWRGLVNFLADHHRLFLSGIVAGLLEGIHYYYYCCIHSHSFFFFYFQ